ncbi:proton-associated sugar transporter A-like [Topomyia yanbarensis]|uniref:proton-associated sugar transporter A-like n=1 Tax=Topomyia yanbarensis TaxID=2498891 RepID=UPI00273C1308|nr:proton-associated sugar transporter A-like [Topomyia yanbarensis]
MSNNLNISDRMQVSDARLMECILKKRYEHAKLQKKDYSHVFRPKTRCELTRLTLLFVGIQFTYAAQTAYVTPILLGIGLSHTFMTMIWAISPTLGFFFAPAVASFSDQIRLGWGRRRPVLLGLGAGLIVGLLILPHGKNIGIFLGDADVGAVNQCSVFRWGTLMTVLGMILVDYNVETCNGVARTYFMDICIKDDHPKVLAVAVMIGGLGGFVGYMLGSVDWSQTNIGDLLGSNEATVFAAVVIVVLIGLTATLSSFREVPLPLLEQDELLRPIRRADFEAAKMQREFCISSVSGGNVPIGFEVAKSSGKIIENDDYERPLGIKLFFTNLIGMPKALRILYFTQFLSHLGYLSYCLYFTDFVGREIFFGDVTAAEDSIEFESYNEGVRFGCMGMAVFILSSSVYSVIFERVIQKFRAKPVYITGLLLNGAGMLATAIIKQKFSIFICCFTMGIKYTTICSLPFLLISEYHTKNSFEMVGGRYVPCTQNRGFGADVSTLSSMLFLAQIITSLAIGSIIDAIGATTIVIYSASLFSCLAAISATRIVFLNL